MVRITDQYFWSVVFWLFFAVVLVLLAIILDTEARVPWVDIKLFEWVLLALASWQLTRLVTVDETMRWLREQSFDVVKSGRGYRLEKPVSGPRRVLAELLINPWTFGIWAATLVIFFYQITTFAIFPIVVLALAAAAGQLQSLSHLIGHNAERARKQSEML